MQNIDKLGFLQKKTFAIQNTLSKNSDNRKIV